MLSTRIQMLKDLPDEFDFEVPHQAIFQGTYHAKKQKHNYLVTWESPNENGTTHHHHTTFTTKDFRLKIFDGEFVPVNLTVKETLS